MTKFGLIAAFTMTAATIACSGSSPTAPTPVVTTPTQPPVVVVPPVVVQPPAPNPLLSDPRFNLGFYRQFAHNGNLPLRRQNGPPTIYLMTVDDVGAPMDALTLNQTAAALESTAGALTGVYGLAGLERGTAPTSRPNQITVRWSAVASPQNFCGSAVVGGNEIVLFPRTPNCRCAGGPAVNLATVKHELGHTLGFHHTDSRLDLMYAINEACDAAPSERERFHAAVAYAMPNGSPAP